MLLSRVRTTPTSASRTGPTIVSASVCGSTTGNQELCCYLRELTEIDRVSGMRAHTRYSAGRSAQPVEHFVLVGEVQNPTQQGEQRAVAVLHSWTASPIHAALPAAVHVSCALCDSSSQNHQTVFRRVSATSQATSPAVGTESAGFLPRQLLSRQWEQWVLLSTWSQCDRWTQHNWSMVVGIGSVGAGGGEPWGRRTVRLEV